MTEQEIKDKINQLVVFWEKDYRDREKSNNIGDALCFAMEELADWFLEKIYLTNTESTENEKD